MKTTTTGEFRKSSLRIKNLRESDYRKMKDQNPSSCRQSTKVVETKEALNKDVKASYSKADKPPRSHTPIPRSSEITQNCRNHK
jgi:hypothetical protein